MGYRKLVFLSACVMVLSGCGKQEEKHNTIVDNGTYTLKSTSNDFYEICFPSSEGEASHLIVSAVYHSEAEMIVYKSTGGYGGGEHYKENMNVCHIVDFYYRQEGNDWSDYHVIYECPYCGKKVVDQAANVLFL